MPATVHQFLCLEDNFGVLVHDEASGATAAIDAPEAAAVERALSETGWKLTDIVVTHHHSDHTAGIPALKRNHGCRVVAPRAEAARIGTADETVADGDTVKVGSLTARVLETPGHTAGHVSYWFEADRLAFVGDTLFSIGCGRVIEGDAAMMWNSLCKLRALPDDTVFYCGHEYTKANIAFALTIDPDNAALKRRANEVEALRAQGKATLPATIGAEKAANPFLRADDPNLASRLGLSGRPPAEVFAKIRGAKDTFRG
ncbi:MAG TPA: hydroxyacylglutathione hydrolase [Xanthobacteraceae bacterium]|nr:hydroxyacylglutathione hydrolase [Xanthobacteraceae bacterium]